MGVLSDLLANAKAFPTQVNLRSGSSVYRQLNQILADQGDLDYPASCLVGNEVQSIAQHVHATGGTYTLTFTLFGGTTFTTAAIAYDAVHGTIQSAIDTAAAAASVAGFVAGDIAVTGGPLSSGAVTLTFSGTSVAGKNHGLTTINGASLTYNAGQGTAGAATTSTQGDGSHDEVQNIASYANAVNGGTFTLTLNLSGASAITTAPIAYNANAATIKGAINTAVTAAAYPAWTNDDIAVTGGPLTTTPVVLTYSGASVTHVNQGQATISGASLTAAVAGTAGALTLSSDGQTKRTAWASLMVLGLITSGPPSQGADPSNIVARTTKGNFPHQLEAETVSALIDEAVYEDGDAATRTVLLAILGY